MDYYSFLTTSLQTERLEWGLIIDEFRTQTLELKLPTLTDYKIELTINNVELDQIVSLPYSLSNDVNLFTSSESNVFIQTIECVKGVISTSQTIKITFDGSNLNLSNSYVQKRIINLKSCTYLDLPLGNIICRLYLPDSPNSISTIYYPKYGIGLLPALDISGSKESVSIDLIILSIIDALSSKDDQLLLRNLQTVCNLAYTNYSFTEIDEYSFQPIKGINSVFSRMSSVRIGDDTKDLKSNAWLAIWILQSLSRLSDVKPAQYIDLNKLRFTCKAFLDGIAISLLSGFDYNYGTVAGDLDDEGRPGLPNYQATVLTAIVLQELNAIEYNSSYELASHYIYKHCLSKLNSNVLSNVFSIFEDFESSENYFIYYLWDTYTTGSTNWRILNKVNLDNLEGNCAIYKLALDNKYDLYDSGFLVSTSSTFYTDVFNSTKRNNYNLNLTNLGLIKSIKSANGLVEYLYNVSKNSWPYGQLWKSDLIVEDKYSTLGSILSAVSTAFYKYILDFQNHRNGLTIALANGIYLDHWSRIIFDRLLYTHSSFWREWLVSFNSRSTSGKQGYIAVTNLLGFTPITTDETLTDYCFYSVPNQIWVQELPTLKTIKNSDLSYESFLDLVYERRSVLLNDIDYPLDTLLNITVDTIRPNVGIKQKFLASDADSIANGIILTSTDYRLYPIAEETSTVTLRGTGNGSVVYNTVVKSLTVGTKVVVEMFTYGEVTNNVTQIVDFKSVFDEC